MSEHTHNHAPPADPGRTFLLGIGLNVVFVIVEAVFGFASGSLARLADAGLHERFDSEHTTVQWEREGACNEDVEFT